MRESFKFHIFFCSLFIIEFFTAKIMADIFSLFVSRVIKGNRYAQVSAEENDCEWKEDDILKQHLR